MVTYTALWYDEGSITKDYTGEDEVDCMRQFISDITQWWGRTDVNETKKDK
jgi:hypothetical protein